MTTGTTRKTGIPQVGDVPWGTHFCHFYQTQEDLYDIIIPYLKTGLESHERCLWLIAEALNEGDWNIIRRAIPDIDGYLAAGDIKISLAPQWYLEDDTFDTKRVINNLEVNLAQALTDGYAGLRVAANEAWLSKKQWEAFPEYEKELNQAITDQRMVILCAYPLAASNADVIFDVAHTHQFVIARQHGNWETLETPELKQTRTELSTVNERLEQIVVKRTKEFETSNNALQLEIAERKRVEEERQTLLQFWENLDQVNRAIQGTNNLEQMMSDVLDVLLSIFDCDRAWMVYPCDPEAATWQVPMERTRPEYPGVLPIGVELPLDSAGAAMFRALLDAPGPVQFNPQSEHQVPIGATQDLSVQSFIAMAFYPKVGKPWSFGLHQCAYPRIWSPQEERLFQEIGRRLADGLTSLLMFRDLQENQRKLEEAQRIAHIAHWEHDLQTDYITGSREISHIFGGTAHEHHLDQFIELIHPEDRQTVAQKIAEVMHSGQTFNVEYRIVHPTGEVRFIHGQGTAIRDETGKARRTFGTIQDITERRQAEEAQRKSHQELQAFFSQTIDGCFFMMLDEPVRWDDTADKEQVLDYVFSHQRLTRTNDAMLDQYGVTREQMLNLTPNDFFENNLVYGRELWRQFLDTGKIRLESKERKMDGTPMWIEGEYIALYDSAGRITGHFGIQRDVTERTRAEKEIARMNRALRMLSDVNQTVIFATDETALLHEVCRIAVETGGYLMAWVGFAEQDKTKTVRPVTHAGVEQGYLESLNLTWAESGRGLGPVGTAIRSGKLSIMRDFSSRQGDDSWLETAVQRGYKSIIALPLNSEGQVLGTLNIYAGETDAFDDREVAILKEMASDLAFGITALRTQARRNQAEEALRQSEERYRLIAENTADTIAVFDLNLNPTYISPSVLKLRGYTVQEALTQSLDQMLTPESLQRTQSALVEQLLLEAGGTADPTRTVLLELEEYCKDGSTNWVELSASFLRDKNLTPTGILTVTRDVTERKRAEAALRERELHAQSLVRLSRRLEQAQTLTEILDAGITEVKNTIGYQNLWIYLLSEDKKISTALTAGGPMTATILSEKGAATLTIPGDRILEEIAEAREIVIVEDAQTDERTNKELAARLGNRTIINVPIFLFEKHLGAVGTGTFGDEGIRIPTQTEQEYLIAVASHFAVSLDRVHSLAERERAVSALRENEERYRIVADNTYDWEFWTDPNGQFLYNSPSCQRITGYSADQFVRDPSLLRRIVHPDDYEQFLHHEAQAQEAKLPGEIEFGILHADGSMRYIGHACQPVYDEQGQYLGNRGSNRDITERRQAEEALRASEERFSKAFHLSPMGIAIFRAADGRFVDVNDVFLQTSGYGREEIIGRTALELQLYGDPEERDFLLQKLYETGTLETFEFKTRNKAGETGVGLSATTEITLGGEKHYLSLILDITERKRAEEERQIYLWFLESLDQVNRAIQGANDLEQMMSNVLDVVLDIFGCDRAWLLYPCDPGAASWSVPVERTRPEYPGAMAIGMEVSMTAEAATLMHTVLSADGPVRFDPDSEYPLAAEDAQQFGYQSQISMALNPQAGKPWMFGLHQCAYARVWTPQEERLFQEVGRRLADALTGLLAHRELRESEERYRTIFQNAPLGIFRSTFDGRFLEVNPALARILGYDSPESVIREIHDIAEQVYIHPEIRHKILPQQLNSTGVIQYLDRFRRKDSSEFIANLYLKTIRDGVNRPVFLEGIIEDITEREQTAGDLRKLSHAIEQSPVAIVITNTNGVIEYVNPRFTQLSGYGRDEVLGKNPRLLKSGETILEDYRRLWDTITHGGSWQGEFHNKKKTGELFWVSASISPVFDPQGNIKHFVGVQEDITARKQRERALEALVTVAMALRAAPGRDEVLHIVVNQVYNLMRTGSVALLLRYPEDDGPEVTAVHGAWENWSSERFPLGKEISDRVIATGQPYINNDVQTDTPFHHPDLIGDLVAAACVPLIAENKVIGVLWVGQQSPIRSHDVQLLKTIADMAATAIRRTVLYEQTQRYAAELEARVAERTRELGEANEQLLELDRLKTKFVSDVSHELRTPITSLQLHLDLLKHGKPERRDHYLDVLRQQASRLNRLVEDILDLARLELRGSQVSLAPVDLNQLVDQIITTYQPSAENASLRLIFEPGPDLPPVIGEMNQLAQIVTNLVANALNYTIQGGIRVRTQLEDRFVCLEVEDTGIGINPEDLPHLFERFYRGKNVSQGNIPGTGLGLAIVKEIVELHKGSIEVKSQPGKGSVFSVRLPFEG